MSPHRRKYSPKVRKRKDTPLPNAPAVRNLSKESTLVRHSLARAIVSGGPQDFREVLQEWVQDLRRERSNREVSKLIGLSERGLYKLLERDANPTLETVYALITFKADGS